MRKRKLQETTASSLAFLTLAAVLTLAAFAAKEPPAGRQRFTEASSFEAEISGELQASPRGEARFGVVETREGSPILFTLSLGAHEADGSITFTRINGGHVPGTYAVGGRDDGSDEIRALVTTGSATRPTGVFRGHSGYLLITSATDKVIRGRFEVNATGFLASNPEDESRRIRATGGFTATRQ